MTNLGSRAITWTSALSMICNALLPNEVLGSMGGGILGESNLKKLLVTVSNAMNLLLLAFSDF